MEENVALDSKKQKKFVKSIRGIKKLIKKNEVKAEPQKKDEEKIEKPKPFSMRLKDGKINKKRKRKERGLVYLSHIPHGFYEHQMTQYFKQFGVVTNARVIRSKHTGNSKGFAFVEFREPAVGQIVAETMNNYLMGKRLIKAAYIPPEKQRKAFRKHWNSVHNPGSQSRLEMKKAFNADKDEVGEIKRAKKLLSNLTKNKKKLSELGINYDFFTPVDIPDALLDQVIKQEKGDNDTVTEVSQPKNVKKGKKELAEVKTKVINENAQNTKQPKSKKTTEGIQKVQTAETANKKSTESNKLNKKEPVTTKKDNVTKVNKDKKVPVKNNEKQQKEKEQKLKNAGVKPPEEFIEINADSGDESDSSCEFDSDEYEKMIENDDSDLPSDESEGSDDESASDNSGSENDEESDEEEDLQEKKGKPASKILQPVQMKKQIQKQQQKTQAKKPEQKKKVEIKRKAPQKQVVSPKKPKFEKQNQKAMKKQFKKK